jgi:hypothetical protein
MAVIGFHELKPPPGRLPNYRGEHLGSVPKGESLKSRKMKQDRSRLLLLRQKAADGYYDRPNAMAATVDALAKKKALLQLLDQCDTIRNRRSESGLESGDRASRMAEIKRKIDDGFYDDPNNLAELAERIIKKLGLD